MLNNNDNNDKDKDTLSLQLKNAELSLSDWIDRYNRRGDGNDRLREDIKVQGLYIIHFVDFHIIILFILLLLLSY